jgi:hypothetical protein
MQGKVDFIVCEEGGGWYIESLDIPAEIAVQPDKVLVEYAKTERFSDEPDVVYVGVYWRDEWLDETGLMPGAVASSAYQRYIDSQRKADNARN